MLKILFIGLALFITLNLSGCNDGVEPSGPYTVTFVDIEGNVIDEFNCDGVSSCNIITPDKPANVGERYFTRWSVWESDYSEIKEDTIIKPIYTYDNHLVSVGTFTVYFYAFFIMTGMFVALGLGLRESKRVGLKKDDLIDGFLWIVPVAILGARLWYVVFELDQFIGGGFFPSLLRILGFSNGVLDFGDFGLSGLAIHGAFVVALICTLIFTKKRKIDIFKVIDIIAIGFIIAQAFGRWGNFFNQEAHGGIVGGATDGVMNLSLEQQYDYLRNTLHIPEFIVNNMYIKQGLNGFGREPFTGYYHPTFFYESMINLIGFGVMLVLRRWKNLHYGELLSVYLIWYGANRIFIETMRTDPLVFDFLGMQIKSAIATSVVMILGGIALSVFIRLTRKDKTYATSENTWLI